jgi:hypothetical protein
MEMADSFDKTQILGYISIGVILVCLILFGSRFTGRAVDETAEVNITIESTASVTFIDDFIDFGVGQVDAGQSNAVINSWGGVTNGNWTPVTDWLSLENVGNINASVNITSGKTAATYIGGNSPAYQMNVTNGEIGSCTNGTALPSGLGASLVTLDTTQLQICAPLRFDAATDTVNLSIQLTIPNDASGVKTDTLTASATAV